MDSTKKVLEIIKQEALSSQGRLRHWVAKSLHWAINDERFTDFTPAMWAWYSYQYEQDAKEDIEEKRDMIEYLASFWNSEAVQKVKATRSRDSKKRTTTDFQKTLTKFFGKELDESKIPKDHKTHSSNNVDEVRVVKHKEVK